MVVDIITISNSMTADTTKSTPKRPFKTNITIPEFAIGIFFNTFFLTLSVIDYSADTFGIDDYDESTNLSFLANYYTYRSNSPYLGNFLLVVAVVGLPLVFFNGGQSMLQTVFGWCHATPKRHFADVMHFFMLWFTILPTVLGFVLPAQNKVTILCQEPITPSEIKECKSAALVMQELHLLMVMLNAFMLFWDVIKYQGNIQEEKVTEKREKAE